MGACAGGREALGTSKVKAVSAKRPKTHWLFPMMHCLGSTHAFSRPLSLYTAKAECRNTLSQILSFYNGFFRGYTESKFVFALYSLFIQTDWMFNRSPWMETKQTTQQTIPGTLGGKVQPRKTWKAPFTLVQDMDRVLWGGNMIHLLISVVPAWNWARIWILYGPILGSRPQHANYKKTGWFPWRQKEGLTFLFCPIFIPFTTHYRYSQSTWKGQTTIESGGRNPTETLGLP